MFRVGNRIDLYVVELNNYYDGIVVCNIMDECMLRCIRKCNKKIFKTQKQINHETDDIIDAKHAI